MRPCPVCQSFAVTFTGGGGAGANLKCLSCGASWSVSELGELLDVRPSPPCPCCGGTLLSQTVVIEAVLADARPGDRYCYACDWLILRDAGETTGREAECPIHAGLDRAPSFGPGAVHRWEACLTRHRRSMVHSALLVAKSKALIDSRRQLATARS